MKKLNIHQVFGERTAGRFAHLLDLQTLSEWKTCLSFKRRLEILFEAGATSDDLQLLMREWGVVQAQDEFGSEETTAVEVTEAVWQALNEETSKGSQ